jgi:validoxylamine A glucosyltransferase
VAAHADGKPLAVMGYAYAYNPIQPMLSVAEALTHMSPEEVVERYRDDPAFADLRHPAFAASGFDTGRWMLPWFVFWTMNCSIRAVDFWAVGGFDESFSGWGFEDIDLGYRLHRHGVQLVLTQDAWVVDSPHERDMAKNLGEAHANVIRMARKFPEPAVEMGVPLTITAQVPFWEMYYQEFAAWSRKVQDLSVADEIAQAASQAPSGGRIAVIGAGGTIPASLPPSVLVEFDRQLLDRALATGGHVGHHALGVWLPMADQSVDLVVITSRMAGLWDRWSEPLMAEARRIGRAVHTFDTSQEPLSVSASG